MTEPILAWHWLPADRIPAHGRRRKRPLKVGDVMKVNKPPILCRRGLHAGRRILDALQWAQGPIVCRVRVSGTVVEGWDKLAGTRRRILAMADATTVLHEVACDWAEAALRRADVADGRPWAAIAAKRRWLQGQATDEELDAACAAARGAAWVAAWDAAWAAAWAAACAAARAAAWDAAWDAAGDAARAVAWAAARATTRAAARAVAWDEMNADLERRVLALMEVTP